MRATHAQRGSVHFGNKTNNLVESAHASLKRSIHHRDSAATAMQKIWRHAETCIRRFESQAFMNCDRKQMINSDGYTTSVLHRLTTPAAEAVLRHLRCTKVTNLHVVIDNTKVGVVLNNLFHY